MNTKTSRQLLKMCVCLCVRILFHRFLRTSIKTSFRILFYLVPDSCSLFLLSYFVWSFLFLYGISGAMHIIPLLVYTTVLRPWSCSVSLSCLFLRMGIGFQAGSSADSCRVLASFMRSINILCSDESKVGKKKSMLKLFPICSRVVENVTVCNRRPAYVRYGIRTSSIALYNFSCWTSSR